MTKNSILSYADDTAVISSGKTWKEVESEMNQLLEKVAIWLAWNKLTLNVRKTMYMTFGNYCDSIPKNSDIYIKGRVQSKMTKDSIFLYCRNEIYNSWILRKNYVHT